MKNNLTKLFATSLIAAVIISAVPALSAQKKPVPKNQSAKQTQKAPQELPRLLDLGSTTCIPCKMMTPILEQLGKEYKGKLKVEFIDVKQNRSAVEKYKIQSIPTQIFYDANGKEFYRHIGFFPKEDILAKFKEHKIILKK